MLTGRSTALLYQLSIPTARPGSGAALRAAAGISAWVEGSCSRGALTAARELCSLEIWSRMSWISISACRMIAGSSPDMGRGSGADGGGAISSGVGDGCGVAVATGVRSCALVALIQGNRKNAARVTALKTVKSRVRVNSRSATRNHYIMEPLGSSNF